MYFDEKMFKAAMGGLGGVVLGSLALYWGLKSRRRSLKLKSMPLFDPRFPKPGPAKIKGKIAPGPGHPLKAPLSGGECVYYDYMIEKERLNGKMTTLAEKKACVPFYIETANGKLLVEPEDMDVSFNDTYEYEGSSGVEPPAEVKALLKLNDIKLTGLLGDNKPVRITERAVPVGKEAAVCGSVEKRGFEHVLCKGRSKSSPAHIASSDDELAGGAGTEAKLFTYGGAILIAFGIGYMLIKFFA